MTFARLFVFSVLWVPFALTGCSQESPQDTVATNTSSVAATPVAPVVTQAPTPVVTMPVDTRTPATAADRAWMTETLPIAEEAAKALYTVLNSPHSSPEEALGNLRTYKAAMMQCRSKLLVAPRSSNFTKAHTLLFDAANESIKGVDLVLLGRSFGDTPGSEQTVQDGKEKLLAGGTLLEEGIKAAKEALDKIKE